MARIPRGLIAELRRVGLDVREVAGCWGRGNSTFDPRGLISHATAGSRSASDLGELNVILNGSTSAPPPISQFMLGRTGVVYFVADGRCNHARAGFSGTYFAGLGNSGLIGVEGCNDNRGEDWSRSYDQYITLCAVIQRWYGWPNAHNRGHKEHQPGDKSDPTFGMPGFRTAVGVRIAQLAAGWPAAEATEDEDMAATVFAPGRGWAVVDAGTWRDIDDNDEALELDEQDDANALAKIFTNFKVVDAASWDRARAVYERTGSVISPPPA